MSSTFTITYAEAMKIAKKLAHSVSKEATRYYLNGFYLNTHEGKRYAVSTNGHVLTRIELSTVEGDMPDAIIPSAAIKQIEGFKPVFKDKAVVTVTVDGLAYTLACEGQNYNGKLVDGTYPDWNRVIPAGYLDYRNEYGACGFNPLYLAAIGKAAAYHDGLFKTAKSPAPIRLFFQDGNPAVVREADPAVLYVVMPMRSSHPEHRHPALAA